MQRIQRQPPMLLLSRKPGKFALAALLATAALLQSVDAKPRRARSFYAPPQAAMVVDGHTGKIIYANNPDEPRYPASITKVMTLYLLFERLKDGRLKLDSPLRVTGNAASQAPSKLGLEPGKTIAVRQVIYALITKSANDCAVVVAENLAGSEEEFATLMTAKARALGMTNTTFRNASGLPNSEQRTTARDLVTLGRQILANFPDYAPVFATRSFTYGSESHRNHNGLLFTYRGTEGLKTGFTQASGFNLLTSVRREDRHLMAVVLGGRSAGERNARMASLLNASWAKAVEGSKAKIAALPIAAVQIASAALEIPERNPAFHSSVSERAMTVAMAAMLDLNQQRGATVVTPGRMAAAPVTANATNVGAVVAAATEVVAAPVAVAVAAAQEEREAAQGDLATAEEEASAADESAGGRREEGDTAANTPPPAVLGPYHIQVGSYASVSGAKTWLAAVAGKAKTVVDGHGELTVEGQVNGQSRYRARFGKFKESEAKAACGKMKALSIDCMVVRAE